MGMINVQIRGSFGNKPDANFSAQDGGHAMAISRAIEYLNGLLPAAIQNDHKCAAEGIKPESDFGTVRPR